MAYFDVSKSWIVLAGRIAGNAAAELAGYIGLLRERAGLGREQPPVKPAETAAPPDAGPVIILDCAAKPADYNGFAWRAGADRIEISGDSLRGLWNGVFGFLAALGFAWPGPDREELPPEPGTSAAYPLKTGRDHYPSVSPQDRRRLTVAGKTESRERERLVRWAARCQYDALIFSLGEKTVWTRAARGRDIYGAGRYALILEAGGCDLSLLLPRRLFLPHRDLFRMEYGRRTARHHFCPTNPQTTAGIAKWARRLFSRAAAGMRPVRIFHLWPDEGFENTWCACPACRAFSPAEQYRIAVNTAADALAEIDSRALLSVWKSGGESGDENAPGIALRGNTFYGENFTRRHRPGQILCKKQSTD